MSGHFLTGERRPLTAYQRDIWIAGSRYPEHPQFNIIYSIRLEGELDLTLLGQCAARVIARHQPWNLRFAEDAGEPYQWLESEVPEIEIVDFSTDMAPSAACADWMDRAVMRAFPLEHARLLDIVLLRESASVAHLHIKAHHIVADGLTINRIAGEVLTEYAHILRTGESANPSGSSYLDFLNEEARYVASAQRAQDVAFFREQLSDVSPALFSRKEKPGLRRSACYSMTLEAQVVDAILKNNATPSAYLSAVLAIYLARAAHRSDEIVLGVPYANRGADLERRIWGPFTNMLPVRVRVSADVSMRDLVARVRESMTSVRDHERLALGDVFRDALPSGIGPLFDATLSYVRFPSPIAVPGIVQRVTTSTVVHDQDALSMIVRSHEGDKNLYVDLFYACDVFDDDMPIDGVARAIRRIVESSLEDLDRPVSTLDFLTAGERDALLALGTGPRVVYRREMTVHGLFEERASRVPEQVAIIAADGTTMTYAELDARANGLARALREDGVGPDDRVAVLLERGPAMVIALLGVLKAGGAYVPIDPGYPEERVRVLLEDSEAKVVLVSRTGADVERLAGPEASRLRIVEDLASGSGSPLAPVAGPRNLAYVIYTSGSTGKPKGVMVEHHAVVNRLAWMQKAYPIGAGDVLLQKTPFAFDVSVWELFWWAIEGAQLALLIRDGEKDPDAILHAIRAHRVSTIHFVPSMLGPFLDRLEESLDARREVESLRVVFCSGEALPPARVEQFNRIFAGAPSAPRLVNLYGPTEATVDVSYFDCPAENPVARVPIGRPIDNLRLYVLGPHDALQPPGVPGELCIAGVGVARGYLRRPELTQEKFADDPFVPGERMYRTGDLARWLADGNLEYLGRLDGQVKIRGNRIELGEVTNALARLEGVRDALVLDQPIEAHGPQSSPGIQLIGYYVADADGDPARLRAEMGSTLPAFMIPSFFVRVDRIPLTPNGKADRRMLARLRPEEASRPHEAPRTQLESTLAAVWSEVLGLDRVGVHDNYYTLGGDSITALRVRAVAARRGVHFSLTDLVRGPTVAELAVRASATVSVLETELEPFQLVASVDRPHLEGYEDAYPVTRLQLGMLYHSRRHPQSALYQDVFVYTFALPWDEGPFRRAFDKLVARHPALRTSFDLGGYAEPLQLVWSEVSGGLDVVDLRAQTEERAEHELQRHIEERRSHRYRFEMAPLYLFRAHVRAGRVELVFSFHHAILDGGSVANLVADLIQDYLHLTNTHKVLVPDVPIPSPAHYVLEERRALQSEEARTYWKRKLEGAALLELPSFRPHESSCDAAFVVRHFDLPAGVEDEIQRFAQAHVVPVKSVLFAAYCQTLRLFSGQDDVTTGLVTHGRPERAGAERMAGLFLNTVPVRVAAAVPTWLDAVREAFRQEQEGYAHRRYPLSAIQEDRGATVLEVAFNYVHFHVLGPILRVPGVELLGFQSWEETNFTLLVNAITKVRDGRIALRIDADARACTAAQVESFGRAYIGILRRMLAHPHEAPDFASCVDAPPPRPSSPVLPDVLDVVRAFETQAARTPDAVAVAIGDVRWSYQELDLAANGVARRLLAEGGIPGAMTVGIAMDRSPEMIATVLGVAKAGGASLPLDVRYPKARLSALIAQASPFCIVAHAAYAERVSGEAAPRAVIPAESIDPRAPAEQVALPEIVPHSAAYILFTSGSTGAPKGVVMPHRALANLAAWQNRIATANAGGVTLQYAPLGFDVAFQEIFSTLCSGGTLQLVSEDERCDMPALLRLIDRARVERIFMPYVALQQLAESAASLQIWPAALRVLISSGEQLRVTAAIRRLCGALPGAILENQYGPTETHVVTSFAMTGDSRAFPAMPPIGFAIEGAEVLVLDPHLRPVPIGARGEIYVGGVCLADGYLGRRDLTEERFIPSPRLAGERLYRTGDHAMVLPSGAIVCLGRADEQVKVRGFRVEPAEVERAIADLSSEYPGILEAAVVARRRGNDDAFLAAFLVGNSAEIALDEITQRLRAVLPPHMVPSHLEWLESLPCTPSGKRDNEALRRRPLAERTPNESHAQARDPEERVLLEIVADVMQLPRLGVHDDVFDLGATSLTVMRLVMLIEQRFGISVPLSRFLETPTVAGLAARVRRAEAIPTFDPLVRLRVGGSRRPLFLVHPMGGNVLCYLPLARHLPGDWPLYALQAGGADPGSVPISTVPELASRYLAALRRIQPEGPYILGGWSFGGFVAFEMARQLREAGEEVDDLFVIDTVMLDPRKLDASSAEVRLGWFFWELLWLERGASAPEENLPSDLATADAKFDFIARQAIELGVLPVGSSSGVVRRLFQVYEAHCQAAFAYRGGVLDRDITLFRAAEPLPSVLRSMHDTVGSMYRDPTNGWAGKTTANLTVIEVPGDHLTMVTEPNVQSLATAIVNPIEQRTWKATETEKATKALSLVQESAGSPPPSRSAGLESRSKSGNEPPN